MEADGRAGGDDQWLMDAAELQMEHRDVRTFLEQLDARDRERLGTRALQMRHLVEECAPSWLDTTQRHFGAPAYLWTLLTDELNPRIIEALEPYPESLAEVLVDMWRRWRTPWIRGEWRQ